MVGRVDHGKTRTEGLVLRKPTALALALALFERLSKQSGDRGTKETKGTHERHELETDWTLLSNAAGQPRDPM